MRLEIIAIVALVALGGFLEYRRLSSALKDARAEIEKVEGERDLAVREKHATELGLVRAESRKESVREVVRTVTLPPASVDCRNDPAVLGAYDLIRRMRGAAQGGGPDPANPDAPVGTVRRSGADGRPGG